MQHSVTELPFNALLGIEAMSDAGRLLRLPSGGQFLNHLGSVHASALLALAEASSGEFLLRHFGSSTGVIPVVRRMEAKFRKPAHGAITSKASAAPEARTQLNADLAVKGRALLAVVVELHDESGTHVLSATVEWFIQRIDPETENIFGA
jgi:acyl-coenzyme A thioesterase PaaI-like protein